MWKLTHLIHLAYCLLHIQAAHIKRMMDNLIKQGGNLALLAPSASSAFFYAKLNYCVPALAPYLTDSYEINIDLVLIVQFC